MVDATHVAALIVEAGSHDDDIDTVVQTADDLWVVRFEAVDIEIGLDEPRNRMILATTIGVPDKGRRMPVLEAILAFNFLVRETGGVRMALAGTDGDIVQLADIGLDELTPKALSVVLSNIVEKTLVWRAFVAAKGAGAAAPDTTLDNVTLKV